MPDSTKWVEPSLTLPPMFKSDLPREPKTHYVKTWPIFYADITIGEKTAELRLNDRDYREGDTLVHREFDPERGVYLGGECTVTITGVIRHDSPIGKQGLHPGWCVLSTKLGYNATRFNGDIVGRTPLEVAE